MQREASGSRVHQSAAGRDRQLAKVQQRDAQLGGPLEGNATADAPWRGCVLCDPDYDADGNERKHRSRHQR
jgi:hypothetical protein